MRFKIPDNYQGEESDVVIVSLTRSNDSGDIGFMAASQRLNDLLSRARDILIMIGNSNTFINNRKGKDAWSSFVDYLNANRHLYDGLPVKCERHPQQKAILRTKDDFDTECPDGGLFTPLVSVSFPSTLLKKLTSNQWCQASLWNPQMSFQMPPALRSFQVDLLQNCRINVFPWTSGYQALLPKRRNMPRM